MSQNVAEQISSSKPKLYQKIVENEDITNILIALLGKLVITYSRAGEIRLSPIVVAGNEFRSRIEIVGNPLVLPPRLVIHNDLRDYMASKNIALSRVLALNKHVADFFQELLERLVSYSEFNHIDFKDLKVVQGCAFISKDHEIVIKVGKESIEDLTPWDRSR